MKSFLNTFAVIFVIVETCFFFGLPVLISRNYYAAGAVAAILIAAAVSAWFRQETKLEDLEKRLQDLENKENQS